MRTLVAIGTPRRLQGLSAAALALVVTLWAHLTNVWDALEMPSADHREAYMSHPRFELLPCCFLKQGGLTTGKLYSSLLHGELS